MTDGYCAVGQEIHKIIDHDGLSQRTAAREVGISQAHLNKILTGQRRLTEEAALLVQDAFGLSASMLLALQTTETLEQARKAHVTRKKVRTASTSSRNSSTASSSNTKRSSTGLSGR